MAYDPLATTDSSEEPMQVPCETAHVRGSTPNKQKLTQSLATLAALLAVTVAVASFMAPGGARGAQHGQALRSARLLEEKEPLYVLGYGSLLLRFSTIKTTCEVADFTAKQLQEMESWAMGGTDAEAQRLRDCIRKAKEKPFTLVKARNVRRGWYAPGKLQYEGLNATDYTPASMEGQALDVAPTYLGAVADPAAECYAVIYPVSEDELKLIDERELAGPYSPGFLLSPDLEILGSGPALPENAKVRWFPMDEKAVKTPTAVSPIVQSYVDIFVGGALEKEDEYEVPGFATSVVASTYAWSEHWVNDRLYPYRPFSMNDEAFRITQTLEKVALMNGSTLKASHLRSISFPRSP